MFDIFYYSGSIHRDGGPAYIEYHENGAILLEGHFIRDVLHKEDGPAYIWYHRDGTISTCDYYINGEKMPEVFLI